MNKTYKSILILVILIFVLILYLFNSEYIISNLLSYTKLFFTKIFPVNFIFYIFSSLLIDYGFIYCIDKYLRVRGSTAYIFFMSLLSGFPSGSKYTKDLLDKNIIDLDCANKYIMFSHFPNPLFIIGSVSMVLNKVIAFKVLISIIISNVIIMFIFKSSNKNYSYNFKFNNNFSLSLYNSIYSSFKTIILIYGNSVFFYLLSTIILKYINLGNYFYILISGIFDLTKGVFSVIVIDNIFIKSLLILFFISFGGISIHMQVNSIISNSSIKYSRFLFGRIVSTIISIIIFIIIYKL